MNTISPGLISKRSSLEHHDLDLDGLEVNVKPGNRSCTLLKTQAIPEDEHFLENGIQLPQ